MDVDVISNPLRVIHEGYLIKSPPESKMREWMRWKKRYFRLWSDKRLEYYKDEKAKEGMKDAIDLSNCTPEGNLVFRNRKNVFSIKTQDRKYYFVGKTIEDMRSWMIHISSLCNLNSRAEPTQPPAPGGFFPGSQLHLKAQSSPTEMRKLSPVHCNKERSLPSVLDLNVNGSSCSYDRVPPPRKVSIEALPLPALPIGSEVSKISSHRPGSSRKSTGLEYDLVPAPQPFPNRLSSNSSSSSSRSRSPESILPNVAARPGTQQSHLLKRDSYVEMISNQDHPNSGNETDITIYDCVPPPRPARPSTSNKVDKEIGYVDMQSTSSDQSLVIPPPLPDQTYSGYDFIPKVNSSTELNTTRDQFQFDCPISLNSKSPFTTSQSDGAISSGSISSYCDSNTPPPQVNRSVKPKSAAAPAVNRRRKPTSGGSGSDTPPIPPVIQSKGNRHTYSNDYGEFNDPNNQEVFMDNNENIHSTPSTPIENDSPVSLISDIVEKQEPPSPTSTPTSPQNNRKKPLHYADVKFATAQKHMKKSFKNNDDETPYSVMDLDLTAAINLAIKEQGKDSLP